MARVALPPVGLEQVCRVRPVHGGTTCYWRVRHNRVQSPRLRALTQCVGARLAGHRYREGTAATDRAAVQAAFRAAVQACRQAAAPGRVTIH